MTELEKKVIALFEDGWHVEEDYAHFEVIEDGDWEVDCKCRMVSFVVISLVIVSPSVTSSMSDA